MLPFNFSILESGAIPLYSLVAIIDIIVITYYLQLKEYRLDRLSDFIRFDEGKNLIQNLANIINTITCIIALCLIFVASQSVLRPVIFFLVILIGTRALQIRKRGLLRPKPTGKSMLIVFSSITLQIGLIALSIKLAPSLPFAVLLLSPIITTIVAFIFNIPTQVLKVFIIKKATRKIKRLKKLTTIGITGSYGKSSTKTILRNLYAHNSHLVLATPKNINTEIGIARVILRKLTKSHRTFIVEMGAYKKGEIKVLAKMCQPEIGIITAVGEQHLSLMGSLKNIRRTKQELVENLVGRKIAILNADNIHCLKIGRDLPKDIDVHFFSTNPDLKATCKLIHFNEEKIGQQNVTIEIDGRTIKTKLNLPASYLISNALASMLAAYLDGVPLQTIQKRLESINLGKNQISFYESHQGYKVINDSYNANPVGMASAISLLNKHAGKKFIITRGLLELGKRSTYHHEQIAKLIFKYKIPCLVLKKSTFIQFQRACLKHDKHIEDHFLFIPESQKVISYLKKSVEPGTTILLSNRIPASISSHLKPKK